MMQAALNIQYNPERSSETKLDATTLHMTDEDAASEFEDPDSSDDERWASPAEGRYTRRGMTA